MTDFMPIDVFLWKTVYFAGSILGGWLVLRGLDKLAGVDFRQDVIDGLGPTGTGIYFGARILAVAILGASIYG